MANQAPKMDGLSGGGATEGHDVAQSKQRKCTSMDTAWLSALLRRRFVKALMVANLVALLLLALREPAGCKAWSFRRTTRW